MNYGRFEFEKDFSSGSLNSERLGNGSSLNETLEDAYQRGFENGRNQKLQSDHDLLVEQLEMIRLQIAKTHEWRQKYDEGVLHLLLPTIQKLIEHFVEEITLESAIKSDLFGLRTLIENLSSKAELKIHVSESIYQSLNQEQNFEVAEKVPHFICERDYGPCEFEIRWQNGGAIFDPNAALEGYRSIIAAYGTKSS